MASTTFVDTVTQIPAAWANDVNTLTYNIFNGAQNVAQAVAALGLSNVAGFNPNAVAITGGTINGVAMGQSVPISNIVATNAQVTTAPVNPNDVVNLTALQTYVPAQVSSGIAALQATLGTMAYQNANNVNISAGVLNNVEIGLSGTANGVFSSLQVTNPPALASDVVTLGYMLSHYDTVFANYGGMATQNPNAVVITGGNIDGVTIGSVIPANGIFNTLSVNQLPTTNSQVANKQYVDTALAAVGNGQGSMSSQNANAVAITGGAINGTSIGASTPASGTFANLSVTGTQAVVSANYNVSASNNFGGLNITASGSPQLGIYAYGANNGALSSTAVITTSNPLSIISGTAEVVVESANVSINTATTIAAGAVSGFGPTQSMSLTLGNQTTVAGGLMLQDGATSTNYGSITYQQSNLRLEINSPQTVAVNATGNGTVFMAGGSGAVTIGVTNANPLLYNAAKVTVYGGMNAQALASPKIRRTGSALGNISGSQTLASNTYDVFTMTLTATTTLSLAAADTRYSTFGGVQQLTLLVTIGATGLNLNVSGVTWANGAAPAYGSKAVGSIQIVQLLSPDNGTTWLGTTT